MLTFTRAIILEITLEIKIIVRLIDAFSQFIAISIGDFAILWIGKFPFYAAISTNSNKRTWVWTAYTKHTTGQKVGSFRSLNTQKSRRHPTEVECRLFVVQSCLTDVDFTISSNYRLIVHR